MAALRRSSSERKRTPNRKAGTGTGSYGTGKTQLRRWNDLPVAAADHTAARELRAAETPATVLRCSSECDDRQMLPAGLVAHVEIYVNARSTANRSRRPSGDRQPFHEAGARCTDLRHGWRCRGRLWSLLRSVPNGSLMSLTATAQLEFSLEQDLAALLGKKSKSSASGA